MQIATFKERVINCALYVNNEHYCTIKDCKEFTPAPSYLCIVPKEKRIMPYLVLKERVKSAHIKAGQIDILPIPYNNDLISINLKK